MIAEDSAGHLSVIERRRFLAIVAAHPDILKMPDAWAVTSIMTRMKLVTNEEHETMDIPDPGSLEAFAQWQEAASDTVLRQARSMMKTEIERRVSAHKEALKAWGDE